MKQQQIVLVLAALISVASAGVDLKSADGTLLKATYFPAAKPGPGVLLFHQSNRTTVEAMLWVYARASSPSRKLIYYSAAQEAPWLWSESA